MTSSLLDVTIPRFLLYHLWSVICFMRLCLQFEMRLGARGCCIYCLCLVWLTTALYCLVRMIVIHSRSNKFLHWSSLSWHWVHLFDLFLEVLQLGVTEVAFSRQVKEGLCYFSWICAFVYCSESRVSCVYVVVPTWIQFEICLLWLAVTKSILTRPSA